MASKIRTLCFLVPIVLFATGLVQSAQAYTFQMSEFTVMRGGLQFFQDTFSDGNPPPAAPPGYAQYTTLGTFGPEAGNKLTIDSSGAVPAQRPNGAWGASQVATRPAALERSYTFSVTGIFDLILPSVPQEGYGIRLTDSTTVGPSPSTADDILWMRVVMWPNHNIMVEFARNDYVNHTATTIDHALLQTGHDQIGLSLTRGSLYSDAIEASFYYIDGGTPGSVITFANRTDIFHGEDFTRASFSAFAPVPLPGALWLLGPGLVGVAAIRRRIRK